MKHTLIVMRAAEMDVVHPLTDFSRSCSKCGVNVGIFPSGQAIIRQNGAENVEIVCSWCVGPQMAGADLAPGALDEFAETISNPNKRR